MSGRPRKQERALGLVLIVLGGIVFALLSFTRLDSRLLVAVAATGLVLAGIYLLLPASITADTSYRFQPKFQAASGLVGFVVAAVIDYAIAGTVDWTLALGVGIGVLVGSGFFRSRTTRPRP